MRSEGRRQLSDYRDRRLHQISFRDVIPLPVDPAIQLRTSMYVGPNSSDAAAPVSGIE
jgi:hypothetical protein